MLGQNSHEAAAGPLAGLRVIDMTTVIMGPAATQILGDLGADVIKVESPEGDSMRWTGPANHDGMGPQYLQSNRNKRSIVLNLKLDNDRAALLDLLRDADVLVFNVRPQGMRRLGLDYATIARVNPKIIYCAAVGFGSDGPYAGKAAYDDLMQAASGLCGLFEQVDGTPRYAPINLCDRVVGLYLTIAIISALYHRDKTGEGQEVEVPMFETMVQFNMFEHMAGQSFVPPLGPYGYKRLLTQQRGPFRTKDGHISLVVYLDKHWRAFTDFVGDAELMQRDARFASIDARTRNSEIVQSFISRHVSMRTNAEWIRYGEISDTPVCVVNSVDDLVNDPHLKAVGMFETKMHPTEGTIRFPRFPIKYQKTPASVRRLAPGLGEHTEEIMHSLTTRATDKAS